MKILRFNETYNPDNEPNLIKTALFVSNLGSGQYELCGTLKTDELEKAKTIENTSFKNFSFVKAVSIKEVEPYEDCDSIIWKNSWGHLMVNKSSYIYVGVSTNKFDEYYSLLEKYSNYKLEMLPYFIANSYGTAVPFVVDFFERLIENKPYDSGGHCWKDANIYDVINYIKNCGVYNAYDKLKQHLLSKIEGHKFTKYFDDLSQEDKNKSNDIIDMGFTDS